MKNKIKYAIILYLSTFVLSSCRKWTEIDPPVTKISSEVVFASSETAIAFVNGIYAEMGLSNGTLGISTIGGLSADELSYYNPSVPGLYASLYTNNIQSNQGSSIVFWQQLYSNVYKTNVAISKLSTAKTYEEDPTKSSLTSAVKKQLIGEAKFLRAFFYFYLVQFYGDVPLITSDDYRINAKASKAPKELIYQQMIKDLIEAQAELNPAYTEADAVTIKTIGYRIKPNSWVAKALLARIYLYHGDYSLAEQLSAEVIANKTMYELKTSLDDVFLASLTTNASAVNSEAIWQLQPTVAGWNTDEARTLILTTAPNVSYPFYLNPLILTAFEPGDKRRTSWIRTLSIGTDIYYYPYKYRAISSPPVTEYSMVMRLAEQYLICAEARAQLNRIAGDSGAGMMLNVIRNRAGLSGTSATTKSEMLDAIIKERRVELFTEWGHRWFDLKRTGTVDKVMKDVTPLKGGSDWQSYQQYYPLPATDISNNPNLKQNEGYK